MSNTLWNTIQIGVPSKMVEITKAGKVVIKNTLTKTKNISRSQKQPAIKLVPTDNGNVKVINEGKEWEIEELKKRMLKAKELEKKNKGKDILNPKIKRMVNLNKFEANIAKRAKELGVKKKKERELQNTDTEKNLYAERFYDMLNNLEELNEKYKNKSSNYDYVKKSLNTIRTTKRGFPKQMMVAKELTFPIKELVGNKYVDIDRLFPDALPRDIFEKIRRDFTIAVLKNPDALYDNKEQYFRDSNIPVPIKVLKK